MAEASEQAKTEGERGPAREAVPDRDVGKDADRASSHAAAAAAGLASASAWRGADGARSALALQRTAGNGAVTRMMRAQAGSGRAWTGWGEQEELGTPFTSETAG